MTPNGVTGVERVISKKWRGALADITFSFTIMQFQHDQSLGRSTKITAWQNNSMPTKSIMMHLWMSLLTHSLIFNADCCRMMKNKYFPLEFPTCLRFNCGRHHHHSFSNLRSFHLKIYASMSCQPKMTFHFICYSILLVWRRLFVSVFTFDQFSAQSKIFMEVLEQVLEWWKILKPTRGWEIKS